MNLILYAAAGVILVSAIVIISYFSKKKDTKKPPIKGDTSAKQVASPVVEEKGVS
jgi:hypothetical protein